MGGEEGTAQRTSVKPSSNKIRLGRRKTAEHQKKQRVLSVVCYLLSIYLFIYIYFFFFDEACIFVFVSSRVFPLFASANIYG